MKTRLIAFAGRLGTGKDTAAEFVLENGFTRLALADELKRLACHIFLIPARLCFGASELRLTPLYDTSERYWDGVHRRVDESRGWIELLFEGATPSKEPLGALHVLVEDLRKERDVTVRLVLQRLGTEWGRALDPQVWIRALTRTAKVIRNTNVPYTAEKGLDHNAQTETGLPPRGVVVTDVRFPNEVQTIRDAGGDVYWIEPGARVPEPPRTHASEPTYEELAPWITRVIMNDTSLPAFRVNVRLAVSQ